MKRLFWLAIALTLGCVNVQAQKPAAPTDSALPAPVTGKLHEVRLLGRGGGRFEPAELTIERGDGVKFVLGSGGPHDVAFTSVPEGAARQLSANIPRHITALGSDLLLDEGETLIVSFAKVPPGRYEYVCLPHQAAPMKGAIVVK